MRCLADPDPVTFAERVLPFLTRDPVRSNLACTIILARRDGRAPVESDALWLRVVDADGGLVGVALHTPPMPLVLTDAPPEAVDSVFDHLLALGRNPSSVSGPVGAVERFVDRWRAAGRQASQPTGRRLFRLDAVLPPANVPGRARQAVQADRDLLVAWATAFQAEALPGEPPVDAGRMVDNSLRREGGCWVWEVAGAPTSMLRTTAPAVGVVRILSVYTPPEHRRHGYASACVAAASAWALARGADACALYTDLANPTSNKIYQAIGYRPVEDSVVWRLS